MAVRIAIVEDEKSAARALEQAIQRYGTENKVSFTIRVWHDPLLFLEEYQAEYDIVYMDIRMPALSGMETARNLRKMDRMVMLIFVTSLAQYALEGYTVGAFDYILKPVKYYDFALKLHWALEHLPEKQEATILLVSGGSKIRLRLRDLLYAETDFPHRRGADSAVRHDFHARSGFDGQTICPLQQLLSGEFAAHCGHQGVQFAAG